MTMTTTSLRTRLTFGLVPLAALILGACSLEVTNPGPVNATYLDDKAAFPALVNGAGRDLAEALNWLSYTGAAVARELHPAGSTGSFGITPSQQGGKLIDDETGTHWQLAQRARWTSESAITRIKTVLGSSYATNAQYLQALVWAGYSNRLLGENFCDGVINGGAKEAYTVYLNRSEAHFTEAIAVATTQNNTTLLNAAKAGRASVRLLKKDLAGAATDAAGLADSYAYKMPYNILDADQYNRIYWSTANAPYRAHTVWGTYYEAYYTQTKDPRTPWGLDPKNPVGDAAVGNLGKVPWYFELKHGAKDSPINLTTGWEMRLVEAEAKLTAGDIGGAMTLVNKHRVALNLAPWVAATATEAWTALKRERGIEMWLEARRLGDFRRWAANGTPGASDDMTGRDLCFVTPRAEKESNPSFK
ncbi:MAG: hypothetical protein P3B98_05205 [Gemmatimonadota bacterium]|nr:hypothetical protein [Gemmatimonadota bacterium]